MQQIHSFDTETENSRIVEREKSKRSQIAKQKRYLIAGITVLALFLVCNYAISPSKKHGHGSSEAKPANLQKTHQPHSLTTGPNVEHKTATSTRPKANFLSLAKQRNKATDQILKLVKQEKGKDNFIFSPASLELALALLAEGLEDEVKQKVSTKLGFDFDQVYSPERLEAIRTKLHQTLNSEDLKYSLVSSNSVWIQEGLKVNPNYKSVLLTKYAAASNVEKLSTEATRLKINKWISESTGGMIPDFFKNPLDSATVMVLINALYFQGSWLLPFKDYAISKAPFKNIDGTKKEVDLMFMNNHIEYYEDKTFQYVKLGYKGLDVKMVLALPKKESDSGKLPNSDIVTNPAKYPFKSQSVDLYLPKFKIQSDFKLKGLMTKLGLAELFGPKAIGPKMIIDDKAAVSEIIQQAIIEVDENGTKAAAVTAILVVGSAFIDPKSRPKPKVVKLDRPFSLFLAHESATQNFEENFLLFAA